MSFTDKVVLVTGASRGIGRAIAETFAARGAKVVGTATSESGAEAISAYLGEQGCGMALNVTSQESIETVFAAIKERFGDIDILINNAGITRDNLLMRMKDDEWNEIIDTNLTSLYRLSKPVLRAMMKKRHGRIISIGSVVGTMGNAGQVNYAAAKAGLVGFTKSLAREVASRGITVNAVAPGAIETDFGGGVVRDNPDVNAQFAGLTALGRVGLPDDIGPMIAALLSDDNRWINGQRIEVSGGIFV